MRSSKLKIAPKFSLPIDVAGEAIAILAKRGAGKTNTGTVLVEEMYAAGVQIVILDPVGAWWGVRSSDDGKGDGLAIPILGGQHGDIAELQPAAGALIADVVVDSGQSLLIDLSDLSTKTDVRQFVTDFAERLYKRKARASSLLHVFLEEADMFAPQKIPAGDRLGGRMQAAIEHLVRRGRSRGIGVTLITQRSAVLSKDVLTQADVLIAMRTTGPQDQKAIREWISSRADERKDVIDSLSSLATGEAWVWNPERDILDRVSIRRRQTFDSSYTPKAGERRVEPTETAPIDLEQLGEKIRETAEQAKANDPKELRKQVKDLQTELRNAKAETAPVEQVRIETIEVPVLSDEMVNKIEAHFDWIGRASVDIQESANSLVSAMGDLRGVLVSTQSKLSTARAERKEAPRRPIAKRGGYQPTASGPPPTVPPRRTHASDAVPDGDFSPNGPQQKVLDALAWLESIGLGGDRGRVGFLSGFSPKSGHFNNTLSKLNSAGMIEYPVPGEARLTDAGREFAREPDMSVTTEELQRAVMAKLKGPQQTLLQTLINAYPDMVDRMELGEETGYSASSGHFNNILSSLKSLGLISYPQKSMVAAEPILFLEEAVR